MLLVLAEKILMSTHVFSLRNKTKINTFFVEKVPSDLKLCVTDYIMISIICIWTERPLQTV